MTPDWAQLGELLPAEQQILDGLWTQEIITLGNGKVPTEPGGQEVRGIFLRSVILYHTPLPEWGLRVAGAWITGPLNLEGAELPRSLRLSQCRFAAALQCTGTHLQSLHLDGSCLKGIEANWLRADGMLSLQNAVSKGPIRLTGARLGGDLDCSRARIIARGRAVDATGLTAATILFSRARIRGQLRFTGAQLSGDLIFSGVEIRARNGDAVAMSRAKIEGGLYLPKGGKDKRPFGGRLRLTAARVSFLADHAGGWPEPGQLELNRFTYGAIVGGPITAKQRIAWLSLQARDPFYPQPWEQCANVLREMGHAEDARDLLIHKEMLQRKDTRRQLRQTGHRLRAALSSAADRLLRRLVAYGHKPFRALSWMLLLWVIGVGVFDQAASRDALRPNTPVVLRAPEWANCAPDTGPLWQASETQRACFHRQPAGADYPVFNRYVYSADTLIPLVSLEMQEYWMPNDTSDHPIGTIASWYLVFQIFAGWALSLLAVAGFTGMIRSSP